MKIKLQGNANLFVNNNEEFDCKDFKNFGEYSI